jgi:hypothetical protein
MASLATASRDDSAYLRVLTWLFTSLQLGAAVVLRPDDLGHPRERGLRAALVVDVGHLAGRKRHNGRVALRAQWPTRGRGGHRQCGQRRHVPRHSRHDRRLPDLMPLAAENAGRECVRCRDRVGSSRPRGRPARNCASPSSAAACADGRCDGSKRMAASTRDLRRRRATTPNHMDSVRRSLRRHTHQTSVALSRLAAFPAPLGSLGRLADPGRDLRIQRRRMR